MASTRIAHCSRSTAPVRKAEPPSRFDGLSSRGPWADRYRCRAGPPESVSSVSGVEERIQNLCKSVQKFWVNLLKTNDGKKSPISDADAPRPAVDWMPPAAC